MAPGPTLRPFQDGDFPTLAAFLTALHPEDPKDPEAMRAFDAGRGDEHHSRTLAWQGGRLLGVAETERSRQFTRPGWYGLRVRTADPDLYDRLKPWAWRRCGR